eukprot:4195828-Pleurochrysis_carterae.AAC.1
MQHISCWAFVRNTSGGRPEFSKIRRKPSKRANKAGGSDGDGGGRERREELDGAGGVFAGGPVATVNARRTGRLLGTSASLLSIDEGLNSAAARPVFRSPRSPPR